MDKHPLFTSTKIARCSTYTKDLMNNENLTGISIMKMDENLDDRSSL